MSRRSPRFFSMVDSEGPSVGMIVGLIFLGIVIAVALLAAYFAIRHFLPAGVP